MQYGGDKVIEYFNGTVFNSGAGGIVNAINTVGVMGAGIALEFKLRYPDMYLDYEKKCKQNNIEVGKVDYYTDNPEILIINFPTKRHFKYPSKMSWIEDGLKHFVKTYKDYNVKSIAFPKLGSSHGGLEWEEVKTIMERYLSNLDIKIIICLDDKKEAEGIEKDMVDKLNKIDINLLQKEVKLNSKQVQIIKSSIPLDRFWKLGKLESIGAKTYEKLFDYFYTDNKKIDSDSFKQQSFFEE